MLESSAAPGFVKNNSQEIAKKVVVIDAAKILQPQSFLENTKSHYFIHSAGYVNLSVNPDSKAAIFKENLTFTKDIFETYRPFLKKFIYISTAFSIGKLDGLLNDNYVAVEQKEYRNFYEASKHAAEKYLVKAGEINAIPIQILRPSVLGGNIMENSSFFISKYMVFYLFAKFFHRSSSKDSVRIQANKDSKLNIIPTDYAAKVITKVFDTAVEQLNIVNSRGTQIFEGITKILETVDFKNFRLTEELRLLGADHSVCQNQWVSKPTVVKLHIQPFFKVGRALAGYDDLFLFFR